MKLESEKAMKSPVIKDEENTKPQSIEEKEIQLLNPSECTSTPFHRSDIEYLSKYSVYIGGNRRAVIFQTTDTQYGYRCFVGQVFQQDVLIPNKSIHYVENAAEKWSQS
tara:strand:+ start:141 stop:467 length:327 start_codon:yes stop_codon:yes gene_type:complete